MLKKMAAIGLTAGALVLVGPAMANATTGDYTETPGVTVGHPNIDACSSSTITFGQGYFEPSENVGVSVSGLDGANAQISGNVAASDGSLTVSFAPPKGGSGEYDVAFNGSHPYTATIFVASGDCDHDPAAATGTELPLTGGGTFELALTGGSISPWVLGGGAAALAAGGALVIAGARRKRS